MTTENLALFKAMGAKMDFLNQRQRVIAQNVSNSDTPGYRPKDIKEGDFDAVLKNITNGGDGRKTSVPSVRLDTTSRDHIVLSGNAEVGPARKERDPYEVSPAGNAVVMEEQLIKASQTAMDYNLMTNMYQKYTSLIKTAIGKSQ